MVYQYKQLNNNKHEWQAHLRKLSGIEDNSNTLLTIDASNVDICGGSLTVNNITSFSGQDLNIRPFSGENLILEASGGGVLIFKQDGIVYNIADLSNTTSGGNGGGNGGGNDVDVSFQNVDISQTLRVNNIEVFSDISSGLGEIDVSFIYNTNTLEIDAKNMLYATKYCFYDANTGNTTDISDLSINNFKNNAQIVIYLDNSGNTVKFRGSENGGINNCKVNFFYDISLDDTNSLLTLTRINDINFLMVSEFS